MNGLALRNSGKYTDREVMTRDVKFTIDAKGLLVKILAGQDAIFWPIRDPLQPWWSHKWDLLWNYRERGLAWRAGGSKQSERNLKLLADRKLVKVFRPRTKSLQFVVTERGDTCGRALSNCNDLDDGTETVKELYRLRKTPTWIPEIALNHERGWGDGHEQELATIAQLALPALVAGTVQCNSDCQRHVSYKLTQSGFDIATGKTEPTIDADLPEALEDGLDLYYLSFGHAIDALKSMTDRLQEIGEIPLPVSMPFQSTQKKKTQ
jgi:hypothetical protein